MDGYSIGYSCTRGKLLNRTLVGNSIGYSRGRAFFALFGSTIGYSRPRGKVDNRTLIANAIGYSRTRGKIAELRIDGSAIGNSMGKVALYDYLPAGLYGISFILSDRQIITDTIGLEGLSFIMSDRMIISQSQGFQGASAVLSDQQPFSIQVGMNSVNIEAITDEQWFEPQNGMNAVNVEIDVTIGRAFKINK
jgi:hypothetical protein